MMRVESSFFDPSNQFVKSPEESKGLDVSEALVAAIGEKRLAHMPEVNLSNKDVEYGPWISLGNIPLGVVGIKGTEREGRKFVAFAVLNPSSSATDEAAQSEPIERVHTEETTLLTVYQENLDLEHRGQKPFYLRWSASIPTNDKRLLRNDCISEDACDAIKQIFLDQHPDLMLGRDRIGGIAGKLMQKKIELKREGVSDPQLHRTLNALADTLIAQGP
jgi:hypothetical protein